MENSIFPPPLGHPSSDSPAVNANPCPSVTGIASNRQNYNQMASLFSRAIRKSFAWKLHGKFAFSTAARSPVVRFTRGRRQSMPVSNGHRLKPSKLQSNGFAFFQGHPKIIPHGNNMENSLFPPPLGHPSSDSPAVDANPCPSVTGIASNRQNYIQMASLFPGPSENHYAWKINMENSLFPPPLGHPSSDSPAVDANPCPSVTGIASNRQNYIQWHRLFPGPSENHSALKLHGKFAFSTAARSPVVRFTRG
jgi:hypothetical protein